MSTASLERPRLFTGPEPNTEEWHAFRRTGFGASEAAAIVGCDPYNTAFHIYQRKIGAVDDQFDNAAMRLGRKLEPVVVSEFVERTDIRVLQAPCPVLRHSAHEFMLATPDALLETDELLECKTTNFRMANRWESEEENANHEGSDWMPDWIMCQVQQQLAVTGRQVCHVAALFDGRTLRLRRVERNDRIIAAIIAAEAELWERVQNRDAPEPNWEHARTLELMRDLFDLRESKTVAFDDELVRVALRFGKVKEHIKSLEKRKDALHSRILHAMGDAEIGCLPGHELLMKRIPVKGSTYTVVKDSSVQLRGPQLPPKTKGKKR